MFKKIKSLLCLSLFAACLSAQTGTVSMTGTIAGPSDVPLNGSMSIKINHTGVQNICATPHVIVPTQNIVYQIKNGTVVGLSSDHYVSQDCMSYRAPYYVQFFDSNQGLISSDNWYLPNVSGGVIDIGSMQEMGFNGPIQVAVPQAIMSAPAVNQSITQPAGTSFTFNGTVNFTGTVNYTTPISFSTIKANQVLVNGVLTSASAIDANGTINASAGYLVGGNGGTLNQVLVSDGISFKPGTVSVAFPQQYYQYTYLGSILEPQRSNLVFDSAVFNLTDSLVNNSTSVFLNTIGTGGTYNNVVSLTTNAYGQVTNVSTATSTISGGTLNTPSFAANYGSSYTYNTTVGTAIPITSTVVCSPQTYYPLDIVYTCGGQGTTVYVMLTNTAAGGYISVPATTMNFRIIP